MSVMKSKLSNIVCLFFIINLTTGLLFPSACVAQKDNNTARQVTIVYPDSTIKTYILNQKIKLKPRVNSEYFWIFNQKLYKNKGDYASYLIHGPFQVFDAENQLITKGDFRFGLKQGTWKSWYPDGEISQICNYKDGERQGICYMYDQGGELKNILSYRNDMLDGKCEYHLNGKTIIKKYRNGQEVKPWSILKFFSSFKIKQDTIPEK
jgi:antitoxin component YwqK of YwqJK toxin-antitoxin module